jgi:hypothetical protein
MFQVTYFCHWCNKSRQETVAGNETREEWYKANHPVYAVGSSISKVCLPCRLNEKPGLRGGQSPVATT